MYEKLLKAVGEIFPDDRTRPGLVLSFLKEGEWYASIARYPARGEKLIVAKAYANTLEAALIELSKNFLTAIGRGTHVTAREKAVADGTTG